MVNSQRFLYILCGLPLRMEEGKKEGRVSPLGLQQGRQESPNVSERVGKPNGINKERAQKVRELISVEEKR